MNLSKEKEIKEVLKDIIDISIKLEPKGILSKKTTYKKQPSTLDIYQLKVGHYLSHLINIFEQLSYIPSFIKLHKTTNSLKKKGITQDKILLYHIENYYIKHTQVFERCLQFLNTIYNLGYDEKDINISLLKNHHLKNDEKIISSITQIQKLIKKYYAPERNIIIHRKTHINEELRHIEGLTILNQNIGDKYLAKDIDWDTKDFILKTVKQHNTEIKETYDLIKTFIKEAIIVYHKKIEIIKTISN